MAVGVGIGIPYRLRPLAGAAPVLIVSDTFDRADNPTALGTADSGQVWTNRTNGLKVLSNQAAPIASGAQNIATIPAGVANVRVEWTQAALGTAAGAILRWTDASNHIRVVCSSTTLTVAEAGGTGSASIPGTYAIGDRFAAEAVGSSLKVYQNGNLLTTVALSTILTPTDCGIWAGATASFRLDDFKVYGL